MEIQDQLSIVIERNVKNMSKGYSYIISRDYGFAPNPFHGFLTLATCKPTIRKNASIEDFIIGNATARQKNKLIFIAKVSNIVTFDEYWSNPLYKCKRPIMNGSTKYLYGDNIYHHLDSGELMQENSHHSLANGSVNIYNLKRDTGKTDRVLICEDFIYLGKSMIDVPDAFIGCLCNHRGHSRPNNDLCQQLWIYLKDKYKLGMVDIPSKFHKFIRYDGQS